MSGKKYKEKIFQTRLIEDLKSEIFRVKKMPSGMGVTVVDLYITHQDYEACWLELKTITSTNQRVKLTELQRRDLKAEINHGGNAACLVGLRTPKETNLEHMYILDLEEEYVYERLRIATREYGQRWQIKNIVNRVIVESERFRVRRPGT